MTPIFKRSPARLAGSAVLGVQSDERLVELARAGHERAFEAIVERYRRPLVRYCGRLLPASRSEDAVQQTFLNAHTALIGGAEVTDLKPWLYKIARNAAINMVRQNGWNYDQIPLDYDGVRRPDQVVAEREELQDTVAALNRLPDRQRDALVMREFEGRSYEEIALALDAGDGAVRQLLNRARVTLRTAATAFTPSPLLLRIAEFTPGTGGGGGTRMLEVAGGLGAAGMAKAGATALVAGSLVVGAVSVPLPVGEGDRPTRQAVAKPADDAAPVSRSDGGNTNAPVADSTPTPDRGGDRGGAGGGEPGEGRSGTPGDDGNRSGRDRAEREDDRSGPGPNSGKGRDDESDEPRESDDDARAPAAAPEPDDDSGKGGNRGPGGGDDESPDDSPDEPDDHIASVPTPTTTVESDSSGKGSSGSSRSGKSGGDDDPDPAEALEPEH